MKNKTVVITGATTGIGLATAKALATQGARIIVIARNEAKAKSTVASLQPAASGESHGYVVADLSDMAQVRKAAAETLAQTTRIDVLINNAGAFIQERQVTKQGYEMTFALNHLAPFLLTQLLLDRLKSSAPSRIVVLSSEAAKPGKLDLSNLMLETGFSGFKAYCNSKLANQLFTYELSRKLAGTNVTVNAMHPGVVRSGFAAESSGFLKLMVSLMRPFMLTPEKGADTSIWLAASPEVEGVTGKYFKKRKAISSNSQSYDEAFAAAFWKASEQLTAN